MQAVITGVITKLFRTASGVDYVTVEEGNSTIKFSGGDNDFSKVPLLSKVKITGDFVGKIYEKNMSLAAGQISVEKF